MKYEVTNWDGRDSFELSLSMSLLEYLDLRKYFRQELVLNLKEQGILKK